MTETPREPPRRKVPLRWVTLGEAVGVAAVVISALGLYNGWNGREAAPPASGAAASKAVHPLVLKGSPNSSFSSIVMETLEGGQAVQSLVLTLPSSLKLDPVSSAGEPRIDADWFDKALVKARRAADKPAETSRQELLPAVLTVRYLDGDTLRESRATYDIAYTVRTSFLGGSTVELRGIALVSGHAGADAQRRIDRLWSQRNPIKPS